MPAPWPRERKPPSAQALLLMHDLFARPLPPTVVATRRVRLLVAGARAVMPPADGARELLQWRAGRLRLLGMYPLVQRLRNAPGVLLALLYPPAGLYRSALPPMFHALYPLLYVPTWLWRRVTGAAA